jgi:alpha-glucosidase
VSRYDDDPTGDGSVGDARAKVLATLLLTLRGTPFLYYGEELATRSLVIPNEVAFDPPARRASASFPWWNRDQARGPMAWRRGPGGGFTSGKPWLPFPPDVDRRNVEVEGVDDDSVLSHYRRLTRLRQEHAALTVGTQDLLDLGDPDVLAYRRTLDGRSALVLLNFASTAATIQPPGAGGAQTWRAALSTHSQGAGATLEDSVILAPYEALIAYS